jgi:hypothetical protein
MEERFTPGLRARRVIGLAEINFRHIGVQFSREMEIRGLRWAAAAAAALALAAAGVAGAEVESGWQVVPAASKFATLQSLAALGPNDVWAAGYRYDTRRSVWAPATEHWDGQRWRFVGAPHATPGYNALYGIGGSSANDVWAVGYATPRYDQYTEAPLIEHWDGTSWSLVANPNQDAGELYAVAALSTDDVWTVGTAPAGDELATLVLHWDGKSWTRLPSANGPLQYNALNALAFVPGSNAIWGVGWQSSGFGSSSLAIRFDGSTSTFTPTPDGASFLYGVAATSADRGWAVGYGDGQNPVFLRWNGSSWTSAAVDAVRPQRHPQGDRSRRQHPLGDRLLGRRAGRRALPAQAIARAATKRRTRAGAARGTTRSPRGRPDRTSRGTRERATRRTPARRAAASC